MKRGRVRKIIFKTQDKDFEESKNWKREVETKSDV